MKGCRLTRVWVIDEKLVVADTIEEAAKLFKKYVGEEYGEPKQISAVSTDKSMINCNAIIKEEESV